MIGRVLGNYRLTAKIGEGGMGAVYRAVDEMLDREVAIKAIRPDLAREPQIVERFRSEARLLARVQHPAIATIYSFFQAGEDGSELFLAMEFVPGRPLSEVLAAEGPMRPERAIRLLGTALDGIQQAHEVGIIHRDLKPDNLMLTDGERLKVMDFGIARMAGTSHLTRTGLLVGTLRYMAPEQIRGEEVDQRTDVYALGIVLFQLLTGRVPFDGTTDYSILRAQLEDPPPPPRSLVPAVSPEVERAVLRSLAKEPGERFASVADFHRALRLSLGPSEATAAREYPAASLTSTLPLSRTPIPREGPIPPPPPPPPGAPSRSVQPASEPTVVTDRPRQQVQPTGSRPAPPPSPPTLPRGAASTSYRPIERPGWKRMAIAGAAAVVLALGGFAVWRSLHKTAPEAGATETATSEALTSEAGLAAGSPLGTGTGADANPVHEASPATNPPPIDPTLNGAANQPQTRLTAPQGNPSLRPSPGQVPPATNLTPSTPTSEAPPPAVTSPPQTSTPSQASPPVEAEPVAVEPPSGLPLAQEIRRLAGNLAASSAHLVDVYQSFLDQKEERDEELTANDTALRDEIETLTEAADSFYGAFDIGAVGRFRNKLRRLDEGKTRAERLRRAQAVQASVSRIDQLLPSVGPSPEVQKAWNAVRAQWRQVRQLFPG